jgi:hypothetical protein
MGDLEGDIGFAWKPFDYYGKHVTLNNKLPYPKFA